MTPPKDAGGSSAGIAAPQVPMVMDRAYEGDETRQLVLQLGFKPVVPPNPNRLQPWAYDRDLYRRRNEVERDSATS